MASTLLRSINRRVCIVPKVEQGGPGTFRRNLTAGLHARGIDVTHNLHADSLDAVLVINGTRNLHQLWRCRRKGIRIVQRLGSPNAHHHPLLSQCHLIPLICARNMLTRFVRNNLADHIIYQSRFCLERWDSYAGKTTAPSTIIYNGVDLQQFSPDKERRESKDPLRIINVEGTQGADPYDIIINLGMNLRRRGINFEIMMFGAPWNNASARFARHSFIRYMGHIARSQLADYYRSADFFIPTDIWGAGCPNSVLEALACGVPVLGYQAGVLPELLDETSGRCVPCEGGHFVQGRSPGNWDALADAALELLHDKDRLRIGARNLAEKRYDVDSMVDKYIRILFQ